MERLLKKYPDTTICRGEAYLIDYSLCNRRTFRQLTCSPKSDPVGMLESRCLYLPFKPFPFELRRSPIPQATMWTLVIILPEVRAAHDARLGNCME
jgi:hypothetical protein